MAPTLVASLWLTAGCGRDAGTSGAEAGAATPASVFVERGAALGLGFVHFDGRTGELELAEITCGGGALLDVDDDGDLDAYLLQGKVVGEGKTAADADPPPAYPTLSDRLYRNDLASHPRNLVFTDVTADLGVETPAYGCAAAVGDVDNDGRADLYLANLGPNQLLRNLGGGRFADVTGAAGVGDASSSVTATFLDYDRDGWLDLFVGNNMAFDTSGRTVCRSLTGARDYCGPGAYPSQPDRLYRNRGDGTFDDVTLASGLATAPLRPTLGSVAADFDGDGWIDLYVANDRQPNNLWRNRGDGTFEDVALLAGAAVNANGDVEASMGVDAGDYDNDGDLDIFLTHLERETNTLYRNDGDGGFTDISDASGLGPPSLPFTSFGTSFVDVDNDGWLDLVVINGGVVLIPELVAAGDPFPLHMTDQLFRNLGRVDGGVRYADWTAQAGPAFALSQVGRGAAFGDVDNDGDTDVLVVNNGGPARLLLNQVGQDARWVGLRLLSGGRDALGAIVGLERHGETALWRRVRTDGSYASANDPRVVVGLGRAGEPSGLVVDWPDGRRERFPAPSVGQYTDVVQGSGVTVAPGDGG